MYVIIFGVVILKLQLSVSDPQFPRHIDFLKVGEAIFNNEKFNILKPTTHLVTDHFKDFMLKHESAHPGDRVFIDKNGFRHAWSGVGGKIKSLRKTDLISKLKHISGGVENVSEKTPKSGIISTDANDNDNTAVDDSNGNKNNNQEEENNASGNTETAKNLTKEDTEPRDSKDTSAIINIPLDAHEINSTEITIEQRTSDKNKTGNKVGGRQSDAKAKGATTAKAKSKKTAKAKGATTAKAKGKKTAKAKSATTAKAKAKTTTKAKGAKSAEAKGTTTAEAKGATTIEAGLRTEAAIPNGNKQIGKERTIATTTFLCPFFGVITMSAYND